MKIIKTFKNIELVEISENKFCVRKRVKKFFGGEAYRYFLLNFCGTNLTSDSLTGTITVGDLDRCEYIFNANAIQAGAL